MSETFVRELADEYLDRYLELDPIQGTQMGRPQSHDRLPDFSPDGLQAVDDLQSATSTRLATLAGDISSPAETAAARLLQERLTASRAMHAAGEDLRSLSTVISPLGSVQMAFTLQPIETEDDWRAVATRLRAVPDCVAGVQASLAEGLRRDLPAGPRQVSGTIDQLQAWIQEGDGWFSRLIADGPAALQKDLEAAAASAAIAVTGLRDWLRDVYGPRVAGTADVVGPERYLLNARFWNGIDLDMAEAYDFGWSEYYRILAELRSVADALAPDVGSPWDVMRHLKTHGQVIEGVEPVRIWLQNLMDETIDKLDGTHFNLAEPIRRVESRIAPEGSALAPYYTAPSADFSRPGRTWLPTGGRTRFPAYELVSTWYHEGVPGHHLQIAQWAYVGPQLSQYQTSEVGMISANVEGWALYAERLMDELGMLSDPEHRIGYLDAQMLRAIRVIIDIGMHLQLKIPAHSPFRPGERWTPEAAEEFLLMHQGRHVDMLRAEIVRYLGLPGQAIGYKLGERVWLQGREAARLAAGADFDLKAWHMRSLSQGSLGLDDLAAALAQV
jgi:uncharacterized protein (DUF885 family)